MPRAAYTYQEPMTDSELSYLKEKEAREKRAFLRTMRTLAVLFVIVPCCLGIIMESVKRSQDTPAMARLREEQEPRVYLYYVLGMIFLLLVVIVGGYIGYLRNLKPLVKDIRLGNKTIENTGIMRKQHVSSNNTHHFFLRSTFKLSIEVSKEDYALYEEGDEINIEYSTFSKVYFGYF
ncbi:hypothetical protein [Taibaiella koreensis]|uniref:hypothetical protein n=1 Tax=Taibaiella koreensis TaxID=1268548 RepID=UPI000E59EF58|nr:hypothetical protein [Taibaiella koreensis]